MCTSSLEKCNYCKNDLIQSETNYGRGFCSENCFVNYKNGCSICQKEFDGPAYHPKDGYYFCSGDCHHKYTFCSRCYKHNHTHTYKNNDFYCSTECADATTKFCFNCEDEFDEDDAYIGCEDDFHSYCSKECFDEDNPSCLTCGEIIDTLELLLALLDEDDIEYCSKECYFLLWKETTRMV